jgi:CHAD domain-containing protein
MIDDGQLAELKTELKSFSDLLGKARDLDVFVIETIEKARVAHPDVPSLDNLRDRCESLRQTAHQKVDQALHSKPFRALFLDVVDFAHVGRIAGANESDRHRLRIRAKKLRYMAEFRSIAPAKRYASTAKALHAVQKSLGAVHDGVAAEQLISKLLHKENKADLAFAAGLLRQDFAPKEECIKIACDAYQTLRRTTPFWRAF